ncbi:MAG: hypothetical protein LQ345_005422 [Seirophora villosa]|nr:MAG: hypothetical protein LQ345_005422 [Seirophora villosa]
MAVNGDDPSSYSPIASVWAKQSGPYLELLVSAGASIQKDDIFNMTSLMRGLIETDDLELGEWLFQRHRIDKPQEGSIYSTALLFAAMYSAPKVLDLLLKYGADINSTNENQQTALHMAARSGSVAVMDTLLARGLDLDARDRRGRTAVFYAVESKKDQVLRALLHHGADVNARDHQRTTALHMASILNDLIGAEELLQYHANTALGSDNITYPINQMLDYDEQGDSDHNTVITIDSPDRLDLLKTLFLHRRALGEPRVWKDGTTALEIAMLSKYGRLTRLLKPLTPLDVAEPISMEDYLFDLFEVSSIEEVEEQSEWRCPRVPGSWGIG